MGRTVALPSLNVRARHATGRRPAEQQASRVASSTRSESDCSYESSVSAEDDPDSDQAASARPAPDIRHEAVQHNSDLLPGPGELQEPSAPNPACNTVQSRAVTLLPENARKSRLKGRTSSLQRKVEELCTLDGSVFVLGIAAELPAGKDSVELVHFICGHPALLALLQQPNGTLNRDTMSAICADLDGGSAIAAAERFKREALESKQNIHETRKTARELTRLEVNADHGKYGRDVCYSIYKEYPEKPSWWLQSLGDFRPESINSANKEVLLVLIAELMERRLAHLSQEQIAKQKALKKAAKQKNAAEPQPQLPQSLNMAALVPQQQHSQLRSRQATEAASVSPRDSIPSRSRSRATLDAADLAALDELDTDPDEAKSITPKAHLHTSSWLFGDR